MSPRVERLTATFEEVGVDLMLVTDLVNVRYLSGFTGSNGAVLAGPATPVFLTDFRYTEQAAHEVYPEFEQVTVVQDLLTDALEHLPEGTLRVGYEARSVTVAEYEHMRELFLERVEMVATKGVIEGMRRWPQGSRGAQNASWPSRSSTTCACVGRRGRALTRSSPVAVTARFRTRRRAT